MDSEAELSLEYGLEGDIRVTDFSGAAKLSEYTVHVSCSPSTVASDRAHVALAWPNHLEAHVYTPSRRHGQTFDARAYRPRAVDPLVDRRDLVGKRPTVVRGSVQAPPVWLVILAPSKLYSGTEAECLTFAPRDYNIVAIRGEISIAVWRLGVLLLTRCACVGLMCVRARVRVGVYVRVRVCGRVRAMRACSCMHVCVCVFGGLAGSRCGP